MTDLEKFIQLYESLGIELIPKNGSPFNPDNFYLYLNNGDNDKFDGYSGFYSDIKFDKDGKFIKQGFWE